jgi:hypothetical protein
VIHARFQNSGLDPPGAAQVSSAHSSLVDLMGAEDELQRK